MTTTESAVLQAVTFRSWFLAARRVLAPMPPTQRAETQRGAPGPPRIAAGATPSMTAAHSPLQRHCSAPDRGPIPAAPGIDSEDWDLLFRAALELLARVAVEKAPPDGPFLRLQAPSDVLCECMDALDQLRRSVPFAEHQRIPRPERADGVIAAPESPAGDDI